MRRGGLRGILLGGDPDVIWSGLLLGVLVFFAVNLLFEAFDRLYVVWSLYGVILLAAAFLATGSVTYSEGGLIAVWASLFPLVFGVVLRNGRSGLFPPSYGELFVAAVVSTIVAGTITFAIATMVTRHFPAGILSSGSAASPEERTDDEQVRNDVEPPEDGTDSSGSGLDSAPSVRYDRRTLLLAGGSGLGVVGIGFGWVYGTWCQVGPADCRIQNSTGRTMTLDVSVSRGGWEVFHAEPELGLFEARQVNTDEYDTKLKRYDSAIPIGCSLPEDVTVTVDTDVDTIGTVTETVTFTAPGPRSGGWVSGSVLQIEVTDDGVDIEPEISIGVV